MLVILFFFFRHFCSLSFAHQNFKCRISRLSPVFVFLFLILFFLLLISSQLIISYLASFIKSSHSRLP